MSTLKMIAGESSIHDALTTKWASGGQIALSVPQFYPPWLLALISFVSKELPISKYGILGGMGGSYQFALRTLSLGLGLVLVIRLRKLFSESNSIFQNQNIENASPSRFAAPVSILLIFILCSIGAVQQILVLLAFSHLTEKRTHCSSTIALKQSTTGSPYLAVMTLALSTSTTWIMASILAALIYFSLFIRKTSWLCRHFLPILFCGIITLATHFLLFSSYQGLVHAFNLRWLFEISMHGKAWGWSGSSLLWKTIALIFSILSVRLLCSPSIRKEITRIEAAMVCLSLASGYLIAFHQKTPIVEDLCVQAAIVFALLSRLLLHNHDTTLKMPFYRYLESSFVQTFIRGLWPATLIVISLILLYFVLPAAFPESNLHPELSAWSSAIFSTLSTNAVTYLMAALIFILLILAVGLLKVSKSLQSEISNTLILALLFYIFSDIRVSCLWGDFQKSLNAIAKNQNILYLPSLKPFIQLASPKQTSTMAVVEQATPLPHPSSQNLALLLPTHVSDLCHALRWRIEFKHGIFTVCTMSQDSLWKFVLLN